MLTFLDCVIGKDYETDNSILKRGTWRMFKNAAKTQDVYLFGTGKACVEWIKKYGRKFEVKGVFDNSPVKWGSVFEGYEVLNPQTITKLYNSIILITTTSYMDDIATQLNQLGYENYFGLAVMEAKKIYMRVVEKVLDFFLWHIYPVKRNRILFCDGFKKYGDNAKAIINELIEQNVDCEILWMYKDDSCEYPEQVHFVKSDIFSKIIAHASSKVWVDNFKKELWVRKKKCQKYINTWHGLVTIKKIDMDRPHISKRHELRTRFDSSLIDVRLTNSQFGTDLYRRAMAYEGHVLECGTPRLDQLYEQSKAGKVREALDIPRDALVILYVPTWRPATSEGFRGTNNIQMDIERARKCFEQKFQRNTYFLTRLHPAAKKIPLSQSEFIKNVTSWPDVYELVHDSDIMISDYSTLMFEMGYINRPVFLFVDDYEQYKEEIGVYFEVDELPFIYAYNQEELEKKIRDFEEDRYLERLKYFNEDELGVVENGTASKKVVELIKHYIGLAK